jgi:hypothetical protein
MHTRRLDHTHQITNQTVTSASVETAARVDASAAESYELSTRAAPRSVGVAAPFTEEDSHNGRNHVLSPGQTLTVVLRDGPERRWADRMVGDSPYFEQLSHYENAGAHVYQFRVKDDATRFHPGTKQVPAALSLYAMKPGESLKERSTRGDGSGPEFYLNTVILNEKATSLVGIRAGKIDESKTIDLGELELPGAVLGNTIQSLRPGDTLQFSARGNQINNVGIITITPEGALDLKITTLDGELGGLGDRLHHQYAFTVPEHAEPGSMIEVKTGGTWRDDPNWRFSFQVKVD